MQARRSGCIAVIAAAIWLIAGTAHADMQMESGGAVKKLGRGLVNIVTGWVEVPKRITETAHSQGTAAGLTWGLLRGLGYGLVRTVAGLYEVVTFPFPAPPNYTPIIQPEYVFTQLTLTPVPSASG